jgi:hypothetical protein
MAPMRTSTIITLFLLCTFFLTILYPSQVQARSSAKNNRRHRHRRRAQYDVSAPTNYKISWQVDEARLSFASTAGCIAKHTVAKVGDTTQAKVDHCAALCEETRGCEFYQLVELKDASSGTVICGLYEEYLSSTKAKYKTGPDEDGTVVNTYGIRKETTSTKSDANEVELPASPTGATLVQFQPCSSASGTVPMFVNSEYSSSTASSLYIVQHGKGANFNDYFAYLYPLVGKDSILVAPGLYKTDEDTAPKSWYQPSINLAWNSTFDSWTAGQDAVGPDEGIDNLAATLLRGQCSSYDVYDAILDHFSDSSNFPNLEKVYFVGHSGGANTLSRYSQFYNGNHPFTFRYILANAANQAYFTSARPEADVCADALIYPYQLVEEGMNRYVASRFLGGMITYQSWMAKDVVSLVGDIDTAERYPGGVVNCQSLAQGGRNRRDRNYAWWAYTNILAGTDANVTGYFGYDQLIASGATRIALLNTFDHQNCIVGDVGHDAEKMFNSACGRAALFNETLPAGVGPLRPK